MKFLNIIGVGVYPENLPAEEDVKKLERKLKSEDKKLPKNVKKLLQSKKTLKKFAKKS